MGSNGERRKRLKKACNNFYVIDPFDAMLRFCINAIDDASHRPGGYFHIRRSGGLGPHIKFGGKIWGKVRPSSPNKRKNLGKSVTARLKSWEKVPILGSYLKFRGQNLGYLSLTFLEAKLGLQQEFQRQILGPSRPTS